MDPIQHALNIKRVADQLREEIQRLTVLADALDCLAQEAAPDRTVSNALVDAIAGLKDPKRVPGSAFSYKADDLKL